MKPQKSPYLYRDITAIVLLIAGIAMAFIALFLPPPGEIHESVLFIFAQILIYVGSIFGIDAYIRKKSLTPDLSAPRAFANAAPERVGKLVTVGTISHNEQLGEYDHQREYEQQREYEHQREHEHIQDAKYRRNPNPRSDPEEED